MNLDLLKRLTPIGDTTYSWAERGWYRIVKYDIPFTGEDGYYPSEWFLVRVGWFGSVYGVPGSDRGCPGEYNYQLTNAGNPIVLVEYLAEVVKQYLDPVRVKRRGRDKLPKAKIVRELDIPATIRALRRYATPNMPIQDLCRLARIKLES